MTHPILLLLTLTITTTTYAQSSDTFTSTRITSAKQTARPTSDRYPHRAFADTLSKLITQAENAGWIPMRIELMPKTYHYIAIFGQKDVFPTEPERKSNNQQQKKSQ